MFYHCTRPYPAAVAPLLALSTFIPIAKCQYGVQLIATGECIYRMVSRALWFEHRDALRFFFAADQFAIVILPGCEALALGAKCFAEVYPVHAFL